MAVTENNDAPRDISTPYTLTRGDSFNGSLTPIGDADWVSVDLQRGETYIVTATGTGANPLIDPAVAIFGPRGLPLGYDNNSGPGLVPFLTYTAMETGTHFIAVATPEDATGSYSMTFDLSLNETVDVPNNNTTPYTMELGDAFFGAIFPSGDRDRIEVTLSAGQSYRIYLGDFDNSLDPYLRVYNASGTLIAQANDDGANDDAFLLFTAVTGGTYYLEAADANDTATNDYRLVLGDSLHEADDAPVDNSTPYSVVPGALFQGYIHSVGAQDRDRIAIQMTAGTTYNLNLFGDDYFGELRDPQLRLYDASGAQVGSNDDGGFGLNSYLEFTPTTSGTYYMEAADFGDNDDGRYQLVATVGTNRGSSKPDNITGTPGNDSVMLLTGSDTYDGRAGDDYIDGGPNDDSLTPGTGADTVIGGNGVDTLNFASALGRVFADLAQDQRGAGFLRFFDEGQAEGDVYSEMENIVGSDFADNLRGDASANVLQGGGVSDRLYGRSGDDTISGGNGADALYGNLGVDTMTGGADAGRTDRFIYFEIRESGVGAGNRDIITDFVSGEDRIEIGRFDADVTQPLNQAFNFVGTANFSGAAGELRYAVTGGNTIVQADTNGDGVADFEIELTGTLNLTDGDFLL